MKRMWIPSLMVLVCLMLGGSVAVAQDKGNGNDSRKMQSQVASGQKMKVEGTVLKREGNGFTLRSTSGSQATTRERRCGLPGRHPGVFRDTC